MRLNDRLIAYLETCDRAGIAPDPLTILDIDGSATASAITQARRAIAQRRKPLAA